MVTLKMMRAGQVVRLRDVVITGAAHVDEFPVLAAVVRGAPEGVGDELLEDADALARHEPGRHRGHEQAPGDEAVGRLGPDHRVAPAEHERRGLDGVGERGEHGGVGALDRGEHGGELHPGLEQVERHYATPQLVCSGSRAAAWRSNPEGASSVPMSANPTPAVVGGGRLVPLDGPVDVGPRHDGRRGRDHVGALEAVVDLGRRRLEAVVEHPGVLGREPDLEGVGEVLRGGVGHQVAPGAASSLGAGVGSGSGALGAWWPCGALAPSPSGEASEPVQMGARPTASRLGSSKLSAITACRDLDDALGLDGDGVEVPGVADLHAPDRGLDDLQVAVLELETLDRGGREHDDRCRGRAQRT